MKVLNFYGGAGIGKSTIAADIFSKLKLKGHKTELVDGAGIGYTVISPWETDKVLLDLKMK